MAGTGSRRLYRGLTVPRSLSEVGQIRVVRIRVPAALMDRWCGAAAQPALPEVKFVEKNYILDPVLAARRPDVRGAMAPAQDTRAAGLGPDPRRARRQ